MEICLLTESDVEYLSKIDKCDLVIMPFFEKAVSYLDEIKGKSGFYNSLAAESKRIN